MTKLLRRALAVLAFSALPAAAQNVDIAFSPNFSRSVSITLSGGTYDFGIIQIGSMSVSATPIAITNTGTVATTLSVVSSTQATDLGTYTGGAPMNQHWALSSTTAPAVDTFALFAVFQSTVPGNGQYADANHQVTSTVQCASDYPSLTPTERFRGGQTGVRVAANASVNVWLNLFAPTRSSNLKSKQFQVTVDTGACD